MAGALFAGCGSSDGGTSSDDSGATSDSSNDGDGSTTDAPKGDTPATDAPKTDGPAPDGTTGCATIESFIPDWVKGAAPSKEIYVSPSGDDGADGSKDHPYKTTAKAWASRASGVRINFTTGSFDCPPFTSDLLAATTAPFMVRAVDGPLTAKFDCGGTGDFFFSHAKAIVIDGLEIFHTAGHGIQLDSGSGFKGSNDPGNDLSADFVLLHSHVHDTAVAGIKVAQSQRIWVIGNEFDHIGTGRDAVEFVASDMPIVVGNDVHDADALDEVKGGAHGGTIALNKVHDMNAGAQAILVGGDCTGFSFLVDNTVDFEAKDLQVWGNVITGANGAAFRIIGCHDCLVLNNTYWSPAPTAIVRAIDEGFDKGSGTCKDVPYRSQNVVIQNNIFAWPKAATYVVPGNVDPLALDWSHNLWFAAGDDVTKLGTDISFTGNPSSLYNVDPELVSPPSDVSLSPGSPAIGAGLGTGLVLFGTFDGKCPPSPPDIGAY